MLTFSQCVILIFLSTTMAYGIYNRITEEDEYEEEPDTKPVVKRKVKPVSKVRVKRNGRWVYEEDDED